MKHSTLQSLDDDFVSIEGECSYHDGRVQVGDIIVCFRGEVDITEAFSEKEIEMYQRYLGDTFLLSADRRRAHERL